MKARVTISQPSIDINSSKEASVKVQAVIAFADIFKGPPGTTNFEELENKPTKLSDFENDLDFVTVDDLSKKADKENTYTKVEVDEKIEGAGKVKEVNVNGSSVVDSNGVANVEVPTQLSQLTNDTNFITKVVNDLTNYYTKTETYTKTEVSNLIAAIQQFHYEIVSTLPSTGATNVLYLKGPIGTGTDKYEEYVYSNNTFVKIGDTSIDLSGYVKESDFDEYSQQDIINLMNSVL